MILIPDTTTINYEVRNGYSKEQSKKRRKENQSNGKKNHLYTSLRKTDKKINTYLVQQEAYTAVFNKDPQFKKYIVAIVKEYTEYCLHWLHS